MAARFEPRDWRAAIQQFEPPSKDEAKEAQTAPLSKTEWDKRTQFNVKVIEARVKLKLMRDRTDALKKALQRFRLRESTRA